MSSRLKKYRLKAGLTQAELADLANFPNGQRRVSYYESGDRVPVLDDCRLLVSVLNQAGVSCTLDDVFPPTPVTDNEQAA